MISNTDSKYDNNYDLILRYQNGDDDAFTELFNLNQGLIHLVLNRYNYIKLISKESMESACNIGFMNATKTFNPEKEAVYSSYCIKVMEREVFAEIDYMKRKGRGELIRNSDSMNWIIESDGSSTEKMSLMNIQDNDIYFKNQDIIISKAISFALDNTMFKYKKYLPSIVNGEYTSTEIANITGESRQLLNHHIKQFLKNVKRHLNEMNINRLEDII